MSEQEGLILLGAVFTALPAFAFGFITGVIRSSKLGWYLLPILGFTTFLACMFFLEPALEDKTDLSSWEKTLVPYMKVILSIFAVVVVGIVNYRNYKKGF